MRYPTVSRSDLEALATARIATGTCDVESVTSWSGEGRDVPIAEIATLAQELEDQRTRFEASNEAADRDLFEGRASAALHGLLSTFDLVVLDDPGFWRYLALAHFWDLVVWREAATFEKDYAKYRVYIDGLNPAECVLLRMYVRAQIALENGSYELAAAIPKGTDFWRSHIIRVRTGSTPVFARAFVREQVKRRMGTDELRSLARTVNRIRSNVVLDVYDADESAVLLEELRAPVD